MKFNPRVSVQAAMFGDAAIGPNYIPQFVTSES